MYIPLASPEPQLNRKAKCISVCDGDSYKPLTCVLSTSGLSAVVGAVLWLDTGAAREARLQRLESGYFYFIFVNFAQSCLVLSKVHRMLSGACRAAEGWIWIFNCFKTENISQANVSSLQWMLRGRGPAQNIKFSAVCGIWFVPLISRLQYFGAADIRCTHTLM